MDFPPGIVIESVGETELNEFFGYLNDHCSDNGKPETGYFLPLPRQSNLPPEKESSFRNGLRIPVASCGWRRAWTARKLSRQIVGHIDLRSHTGPYSEHRCLLGMGVDRNHRRLGLGGALLAHAGEWAVVNGLQWLDLEVLSTNEPAIRLYLRAGFVKLGEVHEMFKIDGRLFSSTTMTRQLVRHQAKDR